MIELALGGTLSWKTGTYLNVLRDIGMKKKKLVKVNRDTLFDPDSCANRGQVHIIQGVPTSLSENLKSARNYNFEIFSVKKIR